MIEFMECEAEIDLWALRRAQPHLFELVKIESRDDGKGEISFWRLRSDCREFFLHEGTS